MANPLPKKIDGGVNGRPPFWQIGIIIIVHHHNDLV